MAINSAWKSVNSRLQSFTAANCFHIFRILTGAVGMSNEMKTDLVKSFFLCQKFPEQRFQLFCFRMGKHRFFRLFPFCHFHVLFILSHLHAVFPRHAFSCLSVLFYLYIFFFPYVFWGLCAVFSLYNF